jgi:hypothetical protein
MKSHCCLSVCVSTQVFRFLCGPCRIKGKQAIGSSQNFLFNSLFIYLRIHFSIYLFIYSYTHVLIFFTCMLIYSVYLLIYLCP